MREIKFRAWVRYTHDKAFEYSTKKLDEVEHEFEERESLRQKYIGEWFRVSGDEKRYETRKYMVYTDEVSISCAGNLTTLINLEVLSIMQSTGLHDKNGKEIWEDDLYRTPNGFLYRVMFAVGGFFLCSVERDLRPDEPFHYDGQDMSKTNGEVIGNIYENPELLK